MVHGFWHKLYSQTDSCYLASDSAPLVVSNLPKKLLCMRLLLFILPALSLQLLELQVLKPLCLCLEYFTVLINKQQKIICR